MVYFAILSLVNLGFVVQKSVVRESCKKMKLENLTSQHAPRRALKRQLICQLFRHNCSFPLTHWTSSAVADKSPLQKKKEKIWSRSLPKLTRTKKNSQLLPESLLLCIAYFIHMGLTTKYLSISCCFLCYFLEVYSCTNDQPVRRKLFLLLQVYWAINEGEVI